MAWEVTINDPEEGSNYTARVSRPENYAPSVIASGTNYYELRYDTSPGEPATIDEWDLGITRREGIYFDIEVWSTIGPKPQRTIIPAPTVQDGSGSGLPFIDPTIVNVRKWKKAKKKKAKKKKAKKKASTSTRKKVAKKVTKSTGKIAKTKSKGSRKSSATKARKKKRRA